MHRWLCCFLMISAAWAVPQAIVPPLLVQAWTLAGTGPAKTATRAPEAEFDLPYALGPPPGEWVQFNADGTYRWAQYPGGSCGTANFDYSGKFLVRPNGTIQFVGDNKLLTFPYHL